MDLFTLHFTKNEPLYQQLYHYIKSNIEDGTLKPHEKLPSKRKLSDYLNLSQNTIQSAYNQLLDEGYLYSKERSGYYVEKIDWFMTPIEKKDISIETKKTKNYSYDFDFNSIDTSEFPKKEFAKAYKDAIEEVSLFETTGSPQGLYSLRESISRYLLSSRGVDTSPENIVISSGAEYLYDLLIRLLPKKTVYGIENPGYAKIGLLFRENKLSHVPVPIQDNGIEIEDLNENEIDCISISPSHQFPTGILYPISKRYELLKWATQENSWIIEDDYDSEFRYSGKPIPALKGLDKSDRVIYLGSFSKSFSPALRISYLVLPDSLMLRYLDLAHFFVCPVPSLTQRVFQQFMDNGNFTKHLNKMRSLYGRKREHLISELLKTKFPLSFLGTEAGLHLHIRLHTKIKERILVEKALNNDCKVYGITDYYYNNMNPHKTAELLLGYGNLSEVQITEGVQKLKEAWKDCF